MKNQYANLIDDFGGIQKLHAFNGIQAIIDGPVWQAIWEQNWNGEDKLITCARTCGKFNTVQFAQPNDQFIDATSLT
jgi:hypothetical protein